MSESIKVVCRVRPLSEGEMQKGSKSIVAFPGEKTNTILLQGKSFAFDHVIRPDTTQSEVYDIVAKPIVGDVLNGYNGTVFAYGQTASGKTYTMEGNLVDPVYQGISPRIIHDIFDHIYQMDENLEFHIKVSYFEIYMEKIRDLLDVSKTNLAVHEDKDRVPYVKGATERFVSSPEEVFDVIDDGKLSRHVAVTNMNEHSSRSHSVFVIQVKQENLETQKKLHGKLYLVDLAGSEKVAKTGAEGTVLDEAKTINRSLSSLGNVINALVEGSAHVPYRDSKLTRILQMSLGGNSRTTMVICISPAGFNESESKSTLLFGVRAKTIKNMVTVNEELTADEWRRRYERAKERNRRLQLILQALEEEVRRWRNGESLSQSEWFTQSQYQSLLADDFTNTTSMLTGAGDDFEGLIESAPGGPSSFKFSMKDDVSTTDMSAKSLLRSTVAASSAAATSGVDNNDALVQQLYKQLDDKDDEINELTQMNMRMQSQLNAQEELIKNLRNDADRRQNDISTLQAACDASKDEVKEILQALEELAVNYDAKASELESKQSEHEGMNSRIESLSTELNTSQSDVQQLKDQLCTDRRKHCDMLQQLMGDVLEIARHLNNSEQQQQRPKFCVTVDKLDEEFTMMRLHTSKIKSEAKTMCSRIGHLEEERAVLQQQQHDNVSESKELQLKIQELEAKVVHLGEKQAESEHVKRQLEISNDELDARINELLAREQTIQYEFNRSMISGQADIKDKLDDEFRRQTEQYKHQLGQLREHLQQKELETEQLHSSVSRLTLQNDEMSKDLKRLQDDYKVKSERLECLEKQSEKREQTQADLKGLEDTVFRELQTLHNLRKMFICDLQNRVRKSTRNVQRAQQQQQTKADVVNSETTGVTLDPSLLEEDSSIHQRGSLAQRQKINFLENNLEQLTRVHKQLVKDNADLRTEMPKLEKKLRATMERVKTMEEQLKEAKENNIRDRKRYQSEVDRIREHVRTSRNNQKRAPNFPQIAKVIRAGHAPAAMGAAPILSNYENITSPALTGVQPDAATA